MVIFRINIYFLYHMSQYHQYIRTQLASESKVNDFDLNPGSVHTDDVLRFEVQVDNVLLVHVLNPLQNLTHVAHTGHFGVLKTFIYNALKQLPTSNTARTHTD